MPSNATGGTPTAEQIKLMRHAVGLNERTYGGMWSYRNHFVASHFSDDYNAWLELEQMGYATSHGLMDGQASTVFCVTSDGRRAIIAAAKAKRLAEIGDLR
jgi:hypothetical protein